MVASAVLVAALALSGCGTKGDLECPKGTIPHIDGTCRPPVK
jgi:predicted small lipoprotein YifL